MKFSYVMLPDYPLVESLESIRLADELGFYAVYAADETWHKDLWLLFAAAAGRQRTDPVRARASPPVTLREPTLIAQAAATLDELTGGRAEVVAGQRQLRPAGPVQHRLEEHQAAVPGEGGHRR